MQCLVAISLLLFISLTFAQQEEDKDTNSPQLAVKAQLVDVQDALSERLSQKSRLQKELINQANAAETAELTAQLEGLNKEISNLRKTFEQLAIGGVDLATFDEQPQEFNWQEEVILITQPLLDMLKTLTEKPRKIEQLKNEIEQKQADKTIIEKALASLEAKLALDLPDSVRKKLQEIQGRWQQRLADNQRETELAEFQLAALQGQNISWFDTASNAIKDFFQGRGLTLAIAIAASVLVWLLTRLVLWLVKQGQRGKPGENRLKLHYRVAAYAFTLLTTLMIISTVIVVFYIRGDILLLALSLVVLATIVLGMRNVLPQYIAEAKLMLNLGIIREGERTHYDGLPWKVATINIYSILYNPELEGILRLPLSSLRDLTSRPSRKEAWFPTSKGDFILLPDGMLAEVMRQTSDTVYLKTKGGMHYNLPARDFIGMGVLNLSRGDSFIVTTVFGIDYEHQDIALSQVPQAFDGAVRDTLTHEGLIEQLNDVVVELKAAGASSLDYQILINVKSSVAPLYYKLERLLQQTCIRVCNQYGWGIPFPQITVHQAGETAAPALPQTPAQ